MDVFVTTSWDDGAKEDLKIAKLLEKYELKGTFYVPIKYYKKGLSNNDIRLLSKKFEIGSHTVTHPRLAKLSAKKIGYELEESKKELGQIIHKNVISISYPYGNYNKLVLKIAKNCGYQYGRTVKRWATSTPKNWLDSAVTVEAKNVFLLRNLRSIRFGKFSNDWERIAKSSFDYVLKHGGIWHLFEHSWRIERENWWRKLENVFKYVSGRDGVRYVNNGDLVKCCRKI